MPYHADKLIITFMGIYPEINNSLHPLRLTTVQCLKSDDKRIWEILLFKFLNSLITTENEALIFLDSAEMIDAFQSYRYVYI